MEEELAQLFENNFDCYADAEDLNTMAMTKEKFIQVVSNRLEKLVMPNEVLGGGLIAYQLTEDNKDFLYKKFAQYRLNLIVASHNQTLQYAKLDDGRNADYGDWIIEFNGKLIILKEYDSRREA